MAVNFVSAVGKSPDRWNQTEGWNQAGAASALIRLCAHFSWNENIQRAILNLFSESSSPCVKQLHEIRKTVMGT